MFRKCVSKCSFLSSAVAVCFSLVLLSGCGGGSGSSAPSPSSPPPAPAPTPDTTPDSFTIADVNSAPREQTVELVELTITGIDSATAIEVVNGSYSVNGAEIGTDDGTVNNNDRVQIWVETPAAFSTSIEITVNIGDVSASATVTTEAQDLEPAPFSFESQRDVSPVTFVYSNLVTVNDINGPVEVTISGGDYAINQEHFTSSPGLVNSGDTLIIRIASPSTPATIREATVTIGTVSQTFSITTAEEDAIPDAVVFNPQEGVEIATALESNLVTISGINVRTDISVSGGEYSINGGAFTAEPSTINEGDRLKLKVTSSEQPETASSAMVTIGTLSASFTVTTRTSGDQASKSWSNPVLVEVFEDATSVESKVHIQDGEGDLVVAFLRKVTGQDRTELHVKHYLAGRGWTPNTMVDETGEVSYLHSFESDDNGNLLAVWVQPGTGFFARTYHKANAQWGDIIPLTENSDAQIASVGNFVVQNDLMKLVSFELHEGQETLYLHHLTPGGSQNSKEVVYQGPSDNRNNYHSMKVFESSESTLSVAWLAYNSRISSVQVVNQTPEQSWSAAEVVHTGGEFLGEISIVQSESGVSLLYQDFTAELPTKLSHFDATEGWTTRALPHYRDYVQSNNELVFFYDIGEKAEKQVASRAYRRETGLGEELIIKSGGTCISTGNSNLPHLDAEANSLGQIVVTWIDCAGEGIFASYYDTNTGWEAPYTVVIEDISSGFRGSFPNVTVTSEDRFHLFWSTFHHSASGNLATIYRTSEGSWSPQALIDNSEEGTSVPYRIVESQGQLHAVWEKKPHSAEGTFFASYLKDDMSWQVPTDITLSDSHYPSTFNSLEVVALPSGELVALMFWYDGSSSNLYWSTYQ